MFRVMMNGLDVEALARGEKNLVGDASVAQTTLQYEVVRRTRWWDLSGEIATIDGPSAVCYEEHDAHVSDEVRQCACPSGEQGCLITPEEAPGV